MAIDCFLKFNGIEGESEDEKHKNQIKVLSWTFGGSSTSSVTGTGGSGAGKVNLQDFAVSAYFGKATPKLFKELCEGTHIKEGTLEAVKSGAKGKGFLKIDFTEIYITSLTMSGNGGGDDIPIVSFAFTYRKIKIDYSKQGADGNVTSTGPVEYDLAANKMTE